MLYCACGDALAGNDVLVLVVRYADGSLADPTKESKKQYICPVVVPEGNRRVLRCSLQYVFLELVYLAGRYTFLSGSFHGRANES